MFGFFKTKEEKEKEKKIEEVKKWFLPLTVFRKPQGIDSKPLDKFYKDSEERVNNHLASLYDYGSVKVTRWRRVFADCIDDIGKSYDLDYKEEFLNGCINKFKDEKKIHESEENQQVIPDSKKQVETKLNEMNKKDFVLLFAEIMHKLFEARDEQFKKNDYSGSGWGGSKKKSYKRAMRRTRNSRRTRRSRGSRPKNIHQYKKYNKR
jgi:hypothetical protein